eukprot:CAMPEP_0176178048 /NCGR_PEP_ID=MMETSP0120_2-20121206/91231_1 /TAXON_ID=160619 /ORGANISM="Kryptoperidinium foliaceum, Strain CCMP 1326" /LENGTH=43 /DNA_ID= /DNA_START= /DNA_END= /DNA_ORIENTATION=
MSPGMNLNIKDNDGMPALHIVAARNQAQIIELMLHEGADANVR